MFGGKLGKMGKGEMGNNKDIEEKFKKEISKEVANLKEFLIQQGKEIVKIKQENKNLKDTVETRQNLKNEGSGSMSTEVRGILEKHQVALEKQKENTTKLSKLCLGTLNELEKFEKHTARENSVQSKRDSVIRDSVPRTEPKVEEKLKRLTDENKKLIQLVTTLDQHVNTLEEKINNDKSGNQHIQTSEILPSNSQITKEEISKLVRENLEKEKQVDIEKDAQLESLVTEVQNIVGQVVDVGSQCRQIQEKVRKIEDDNGNERLELEFAKTISRLEKVERDSANGDQKLKIDNIVNNVKKDPFFENCKNRLDWCEKNIERVETLSKDSSADNIGKIGMIENVAKQTKIESVDINTNINKKFIELEKQVNNANTKENSNKSLIDQLSTKMQKLESDEKSEKENKHQKLEQEPLQKLDKKIHTLEETSTADREDIDLLLDKVKSFSVIMKDDKYKNEEKLVKIEKQVEQTNKDTDKIQQKLTSLGESQSKIEKNISSVEDDNKASKSDIQTIQLELNNVKTRCDKNDDISNIMKDDNKASKSDIQTIQLELNNVNTKCDKNDRKIEENNSKIFDCIHDNQSVTESLEKLNKKVDKKPVAAAATAEELDKKSKLSNELFSDLSTRIDDVESSISKQAKTTRNELETTKTQLTELKSLTGDVKTVIKDITMIKTKHEKIDNEIKKTNDKTEETKGLLSKLQNEVKLLSTANDNIKSIEKELEVIKKNNSSDKMTAIEKESLSLRADHAVIVKDVKNISTELKYIDSLLKKETANTKTELSSFGKTLKSNDKDILSLQNMVEVLNDSLKTESTSTADSEKINKMKNEITKIGTDIKGCEQKINQIQDVFQKKVDNDIKDMKANIQNNKDNLSQKLLKESEENEKKNKDQLSSIKTVKEDLEEKNKKYKEMTSEMTSCTNKLKALENKIDTVTKDDKSQSNNKEINDKIELVKVETKALDKKNTDVEHKMTQFKNDIETLKSKASQDKSSQETKDIKKDIDKINQQVKDNLLKHDGKVTEMKSSIKEVNEKIVKLEKAQSDSKPVVKDNSVEVKKEIDIINQQIRDNLKLCKDKEVHQEVQVREVKTSIKDVNDQLAKMEKDGRATPKPAPASESAKLLTLSKAIDSIQDNTKSLETMVTKMKSEFSTAKDLEKLRGELKGTEVGNLQNHPDMGPIMDSLIMTNDRPYVDCSTSTPMTGNGLVKFERFNAMNKLPWDDVGDQFVIQEPGVYCVNVTAILQDAGLSIKLASPMLEREVASLGSRDGLLGSSCPAFVSRSALFQIDDDENCVETVLVEIHADNEDSFIDKNVTLTMFKIAESSGQNDE